MRYISPRRASRWRRGGGAEVARGSIREAMWGGGGGTRVGKPECDRLGRIYALGFELVEARHLAGLTQAQLAARMGTTQSAIARLENARHMPSLAMAARYAQAVGQRLD